MTVPPRVVRCPQCGATVEWTPASAFRPFCSRRCKTLDLGAWAAETYRIPVAQVSDADEDDERPPARPLDD